MQYAAQLDAQGNPVKDVVTTMLVLMKRPFAQWEYQAFRPDKTPNTNANLTNCYTCHALQQQGGQVTMILMDQSIGAQQERLRTSIATVRPPILLPVAITLTRRSTKSAAKAGRR